MMLARTAALFALACVLGYAFNAVRSDGVSFAPVVVGNACGSASGEPTRAVLSLSAADAADAIEAGSVLLLDARSADAYARGHIDRALHLPCASANADAERALDRARLVSLVLVYGAGAEDARDMAEEVARRLGPTTRVSLVFGGYDALLGAGAPAESGSCERCGSEVVR